MAYNKHFKNGEISRSLESCHTALIFTLLADVKKGHVYTRKACRRSAFGVLGGWRE
jgi:hypothetical protein